MIDIKRLESDLERAKDGYSATLANKPVRQSLRDIVSHLDDFEARMPEYVRERHWHHTGRHYSKGAIWALFREALDRGLVIKEGHGQYVKALGHNDALGACRDRIQQLKDRLRRAKYKPRKPRKPSNVVTSPTDPFS